MVTSLKHFIEGTAFELYILEAVRPAIDQQKATTIDLRGLRPVVDVKIGSMISLSDNDVSAYKESLSPLLFGAAWKVLDLLLELSFCSAGLQPKGGEFTIAKKLRLATSKDLEPNTFITCQRVWAALLQLYAATVEHRHCLIHRVATVDPTDGSFGGVDRTNNPLKILTRDEQNAFARVSALIGRSAVEGSLNSRNEDHLKYQLDQLSHHSGAESFNASAVHVPIDVLFELASARGELLLDPTEALNRARSTFPTATHFDLVIDVPDGTNRRLLARAEDCPEGPLIVDLNNLPGWLQFR
jgi:hypothetical protein